MIDGAALYASNCASCHRSLASSEKRGRSATQIQNAINSNRGGMGSLSSLTSAQVDAIAAALASSSSDTTPPTVTGFSIPATSASTTVSISSLTATDNVGVTGYMVTESARLQPLQREAGRHLLRQHLLRHRAENPLCLGQGRGRQCLRQQERFHHGFRISSRD